MAVFIDREKCKGCGLCVDVCPIQAITTVQDEFVIDQSRCNECLLCLEECPNKAIYQTSDKEISTGEKKVFPSDSTLPTFPQSHHVLGTYKRRQQTVNESGRFLDRVKQATENFFQGDSSFGHGKRGKKRGHRGHRKGFRGGRFRR